MTSASTNQDQTTPLRALLTQSLPSSLLDSSLSAAQGEVGDSPDVNGNGRQTLLTYTHSGGAESATSLHIDLTASGSGLAHDVTESPVVLHTDTLHTVSGFFDSHTDLVTVATDSTATDSTATDSTATDSVSDPTGTPLDSSHPALTDHTHTAGPITEQYNPSGQGPEGAENVELEDTC
ncbi:uncharacterized protein si:ch211-80h18.1 isoform X2 [Trematomus bernacchii]|uniref:uncharacterized protein si:ch211-80h18.1 isoform X2 n=1 Tax=Trematomus bernacchii TaxID=40690 RepID=UPI001469DB1B|nr:uncharacterized protein si:ch211-80h18.1 isoform X2 [Trematomus bernacchii]